MSHHTVNLSLHYLVKYKCKKKLRIVTNIKVNEKTLRPNIAVNDPYEIRLC